MEDALTATTASVDSIRHNLGALEARAREIWGSPAAAFATIMQKAVFLSVIGAEAKAVGEADDFDGAYAACLDALKAQERARLAQTLGVAGAAP